MTSRTSRSAERVGQRQRLLTVAAAVVHLEPGSAGSPRAARGCSARRPPPGDGPRGRSAKCRTPFLRSRVRGAAVSEGEPRRLRPVWDATCETAQGRSGSRGHGPAPPPVADRAVLGPAQLPAGAQIGPDDAHGGGLGSHPREEVITLRAVEPRDGVGQQGALPGGMARGAASARRPAGAASGCSSAGLPPRPAPSPRRWVRPPPGSSDSCSAVSSPASSRCPAGRSPSEPPPAGAERDAGRRRGRPCGAGPSPWSTKSISTSPRPGPAGGRCSCAALTPCAPSGQTIRPSWRPAASAAPDPDAGDQQGDGGTGGGHGSGGAGQDQRPARTASRPRPRRR